MACVIHLSAHFPWSPLHPYACARMHAPLYTAVSRSSTLALARVPWSHVGAIQHLHLNLYCIPDTHTVTAFTTSSHWLHCTRWCTQSLDSVGKHDNFSNKAIPWYFIVSVLYACLSRGWFVFKLKANAIHMSPKRPRPMVTILYQEDIKTQNDQARSRKCNALLSLRASHSHGVSYCPACAS